MSKYPYTELPRISGSIYKPLIPIGISYKKTHKIIPEIRALVDSGADVCFCSKDIGIWLGITFKKSSIEEFIAANNQTFQSVKHMVTLSIAGKQYECPFYFSDTLPRQTPIILGQFGFFDHFKVTFNFENKEMELV